MARLYRGTGGQGQEQQSEDDVFRFHGCKCRKNVEIFVQKKCFNPLHGFQIFGNLAV
jgi:hypothetical protein